MMMVDVDLDLKIPETSPLAIWEEMLVEMVEVDIGPIPATLPPITQVTMVDCLVYLNLKDDILGVMVQDVEVGLKISATLTFTMTEKVFMVVREVDIGLRPDLLPTIIHVILVDNLIFIFMIMT